VTGSVLGKLGRQSFRSVGIQEPQLLLGHLKGVGRFGRCAHDQPQRVGVGVVEQLTHGVRRDEHGRERLEREVSSPTRIRPAPSSSR